MKRRAQHAPCSAHPACSDQSPFFPGLRPVGLRRAARLMQLPVRVRGNGPWGADLAQGCCLVVGSAW
eukprot:4467090-Alexandrium_andersonii.AAC.1